METYSEQEISVNLTEAIHELWEVYSFLSRYGFVYLLPSTSDCGLQDLVFVSNNGIVLHHMSEPTYIGSNFRVANRRGEEVLGMDFFCRLGYNTIKCPHLFEGEAELKYLRDNIYIGGYGMRSERKSYEWMEESFGMNVIALEQNDPFLYHLDCAVFPLTKEKVIVSVESFTHSELAAIERVAEIIPISRLEAYGGLTNSVAVGNFILNASNIDSLNPRSEEYRQERAKLRRMEEICVSNAMQPVYFKMDEYLKGGGSLSCCVLHVNCMTR